jgi:steroid 5-alpha reductase family enzyme
MAGLVVEMVSDQQKWAFKQSPGMYVCMFVDMFVCSVTGFSDSSRHPQT